MSADTRQQLLSGMVLPAHLTTTPRFRISEDLKIDPSVGEFGCKSCHSRITRNSKNHKEYGHDTDCDHHEFAEVIRT